VKKPRFFKSGLQKYGILSYQQSFHLSFIHNHHTVETTHALSLPYFQAGPKIGCNNSLPDFF
jgi:hypothetical protein